MAWHECHDKSSVSNYVSFQVHRLILFPFNLYVVCRLDSARRLIRGNRIVPRSCESIEIFLRCCGIGWIFVVGMNSHVIRAPTSRRVVGVRLLTAVVRLYRTDHGRCVTDDFTDYACIECTCTGDVTFGCCVTRPAYANAYVVTS